MLIKCPECSTEVSDRADQCPKCAYPFKEPNIAETKEQGCFLQTMNIGCQIIAGIVVIIVILLILTMLGL